MRDMGRLMNRRLICINIYPGGSGNQSKKPASKQMETKPFKTFLKGANRVTRIIL